ncbi:hypothetical protein ACWGM0_08815 [Sphingomonas bisphenolicum]
MQIFYSAQSAGFYADGIHAAIPADAVKISGARHAELLAAQADGAAIVAGHDGRPKIQRAKPTIDERRAAAIRHVKREAARRIEAVAPVWRQLNDQRAPSAQGEARFAAIDALRAASDHIEAAILAAGAADLDALDIAHHPFWPVD